MTMRARLQRSPLLGYFALKFACSRAWHVAVGNSGNTGEPHLQVHAQRPRSVAAPFGGDPLPILFNGRFPVRGDGIGSP